MVLTGSRRAASPSTSIPFAVSEWVMNRLPPFVASRAVAASLRLAGARIAPGTLFWGMPLLTGEGDFASRLEVGELCGLNYGCMFQLDASITLEDHVAVGHEVMFLTRTYDSTDPRDRGRVSGAKPILVQAGSWLGSRCTIMPGVTIGAGSVVGASVVVTEDLPPNTLLAGRRRVSLAKWR